jgi:ABC-type transport system involved in multi-copper enzyme maturation permease subunit
MDKLLAITILTFKEGIRQRVLLGVSLGAIILLTIGVLIAGFFMRDISKILVDFSLSIAGVGGLLVPFFIGLNMLAGDIEKRTIFTILSQPVSRWHYVIGKFLGLSLLTFVVCLVLSIFGICAVLAGKYIYGAVYFRKFSTAAYFIAAFFSYWGINVLLAMVLLWSAVTTSSFLAMLLTLATYLIGHTLDDIVAFVNSNAPNNITEEIIRDVVSYVQYVVPNLSAFDLKLSAAHALIPALSDLLILFAYGGAYIAGILMVSILIFNKRDIV